MYTINFRFRRKLHFLFNAQNNAKLARLLLLFMCVTFFCTAYLYGLIEISTSKLVIKISAEDVPEVNSNIYDDSEFENPVDSRKKIVINLKQNPRFRSSKKHGATAVLDGNYISSRSSSSNSINVGNNDLDFEYNRQNDKLTGLFLKIERHNLMITSAINTVDVELVERLRTKYLLKLAERRKKVFQKTVKIAEDRNNDAKNEDDDDDDEDKPGDEYASNELITREHIVKFLKYEKYLLKNKLASNDIRTIKKILMDYSRNNEVEIE